MDLVKKIQQKNIPPEILHQNRLVAILNAILFFDIDFPKIDKIKELLQQCVTFDLHQRLKLKHRVLLAIGPIDDYFENYLRWKQVAFFRGKDREFADNFKKQAEMLTIINRFARILVKTYELEEANKNIIELEKDIADLKIKLT